MQRTAVEKHRARCHEVTRPSTSLSSLDAVFGRCIRRREQWLLSDEVVRPAALKHESKNEPVGKAPGIEPRVRRKDDAKEGNNQGTIEFAESQPRSRDERILRPFRGEGGGGIRTRE